MGCGMSKPAKAASTTTLPPSEPHSAQCIMFNNLTEKQTSYIDEVKLKRALNALFDQNGSLSLDYGLKTRNDRWTFWAPRTVKWAELEPYTD